MGVMTWIKLYLVIVSALVTWSVLKIIFQTIVGNVWKGMNERMPVVKPESKPQIIGRKTVIYDDGTGK